MTDAEGTDAGAPAGMQDAMRDAGTQYALPLVVRVDRAAPPARTDALEGAARAVLRFLSDPRVTQDDGEWASGAVSDPATMYSNNGQQHVFYRGTDNGIYHVFYDQKKNAVVPSRTTAEKWV